MNYNLPLNPIQISPTLLDNKIREHFYDFIEAVEYSNNLHESLTIAAKYCINSISRGGKILICGNGGSAADAQHFAAELVGRYIKHKKHIPIPAIALTTDTSVITAIGNDFHFDDIFSIQTEALINKIDTLIVISTSGKSKNILKAVEIARNKGANIVFFSGQCQDIDYTISNCINIVVNSEVTSTIQNVFLMLEHILCEVIDDYFRAS